MWVDEAAYMLSARRMLDGNLLDVLSYHLYVFIPVLLIFIYNLFFDLFLAGKLMALTYGMLGIIFIYLIGKEVKDKATGIMAALLLTFNPLMWFSSSRVLTDSPLATMFILVAYSLIKYEKTKKLKWLIALIIATVLTFFTKSNGILAIFFLLLYFFSQYILTPLIKRDKEYWGKVKNVFKLKKTYITSFIVLAIIIADLFRSSPFLLLPYNYLKRMSYDSYFIKSLPFLINWYVIPLFVLGLIFLILYRKKEDYILLSWLVIYYGALVLVRFTSPDPRYALVIIPPALLIFSYAVSEIREYIITFTGFKIYKFIFIILVALIIIPYYRASVALTEPKSISFTGFRESDEWIGKNVPKDAIIYTADTATTLVFSGLEEDRLNGNVFHITEFEDFNQFKGFVENLTKTMYLETNVWESGQPKWIYPIDQEKFNLITSLNFNLVYLVERPYPTNEGMKNIPVIFIFKRDYPQTTQ